MLKQDSHPHTIRSVCTILLPIAFALASEPASAGVMLPTAITVSTPAGTTDTSNPFTDDVLLNSLTFNSGSGSVDYLADKGSFRAVSQLEVLSGRGHVNAEWGDNDTADDGNGTPFAKAGFPDADQETTDPVIQDAAMLNAFNSLSLSEMTDGENNPGSSFSFKVLFNGSLALKDVGGDGLPDIVFFERGLNDTFFVDLIIGGSFANPVYTSAIQINSSDFRDTGIDIDTVEINNPQSLGAGGFDLSTFGLANGDIAYGFRLSANDRSGPDLGGFFLAAENPNDFGPSLVPAPQTLWMLLAGLGLLVRRRTSGRSSGDARP